MATLYRRLHASADLADDVPCSSRLLRWSRSSRSSHLRLLPLLALLVGCWPAAHATRGADVPPPTPEAVRAANPQSAGRVPSSDAAGTIAGLLREGRITALDAATGRLDIDGKPFRVVAGRTRIDQQGVAAGAGRLVVGQRVAYALAEPPPGAPIAGEPAALAIVHGR